MSKRVIYNCPFVPAEWIAAHGLTPSRITPKIAASGAPNGVCPYAAAFTEAVAAESDVAAIVFSTACDQMRRSSETAAARAQVPVFTLNLPHIWQNPGAHKLYKTELERLGSFLGSIGSFSSPAILKEKMITIENARREILDSRPNLTARQFSQCLADFHHAPNDYKLRVPQGPSHRSNRIPVALIGGPLTRESYHLFDLVEQAGGFIALDGTETGERTLPAAFDRRRINDDPLGTLVDAYFGHIPDPFRRPNSEFFKWLKHMVNERGIRGVILRHYLWCDVWRAESQRISEFLGLPFLELDTGDGGLDPARTQVRIQAFMEVINS